MPQLTTLADGRLAIVRVQGGDPDQRKLAKTLFELSRDTDMTTHFDPETHTLAALQAGIPGHTPITHRSCDESEIPDENADRLLGKPTFRDAWEDTGTGIKVSIPKARGIHMDRIRVVRNRELAKLDLPYMRALEQGDAVEQTVIATKKQTLRDIPQTFSLAGFRTPDTLKAAWPVDLPTE